MRKDKNGSLWSVAYILYCSAVTLQSMVAIIEANRNAMPIFFIVHKGNLIYPQSADRQKIINRNQAIFSV